MPIRFLRLIHLGVNGEPIKTAIRLDQIAAMEHIPDQPNSTNIVLVNGHEISVKETVEHIIRMVDITNRVPNSW